MRFHLRTLELFGQADVALDPERGARVRQLAARAGIALPAAVVEWYCVPESSTLWQWFRGSDHPAIGFHPGNRQPWMELVESEGDTLIEDGLRHGWWWIPRPREDVRGWIGQPVLPVVYETQGCCWWGVLLDGSDNPPVLVCDGDQGDQWDYFAGSFSDFVLGRVFDLSLYYAGDTSRIVNLEVDVSADQLRALKTQFRTEATTRDDGNWFTLRFSAEGQRFRLMVRSYRDTRSTGLSVWHLWAADPDRFRSLVARLSEVCPSLHGVTPDPRSTLYLRAELPAPSNEQEQIPF